MKTNMFTALTDEEEQDAADWNYRAKVEGCDHDWKRLPNVTSTGVKIIECQRCGETMEEDVS